MDCDRSRRVPVGAGHRARIVAASARECAVDGYDGRGGLWLALADAAMRLPMPTKGLLDRRIHQLRILVRWQQRSALDGLLPPVHVWNGRNPSGCATNAPEHRNRPRFCVRVVRLSMVSSGAPGIPFGLPAEAADDTDRLEELPAREIAERLVRHQLNDRRQQAGAPAFEYRYVVPGDDSSATALMFSMKADRSIEAVERPPEGSPD